ncbi:hypothetical protein CSUI_005545 [Cystoisospora suis]|uniref:Uncharacterized protein n=1 Tax=Cystoisospora suis TaxID=483139 RepID=A0A2C6KWQ2_9APIC|nr:hypothetical protein CSUI_005545 [Cystoisospora suis]
MPEVAIPVAPLRHTDEHAVEVIEEQPWHVAERAPSVHVEEHPGLPVEEHVPEPEEQEPAPPQEEPQPPPEPPTPRGGRGGGAHVCAPYVETFEKKFNEVLATALNTANDIHDEETCIKMVVREGSDLRRWLSTELRVIALPAVVIHADLEKFKRNLLAAMKDMQSGKLKTEHSKGAIDAGLQLLEPGLNRGDFVKQINAEGLLESHVCTVAEVHGGNVTCVCGGKSVAARKETLAKVVGTGVATLADVALTESFPKLLKESKGVADTIQKVADERGWGAALKEAQRTKNWRKLLRTMETTSPTGVLVLTDAVRHVLKQPLMDLRLQGRAKKDAQRTVAYVSVKEVADALEVLHFYWATDAVSGCVFPSFEAISSESLLLARVVDASGVSLDDLEKRVGKESTGRACLTSLHYIISRGVPGVCGPIWKRQVPELSKSVGQESSTVAKNAIYNNCVKPKPQADFPLAFMKTCDHKCLQQAWQRELPFGSAKKLSQKVRLTGDFVRTVTTYEKKTAMLLESLAVALTDLAATVPKQSDVVKQIEMDICASAWFKRQKPESPDGFAFGFNNPSLVGSYYITHARATESALGAGLVSPAKRDPTKNPAFGALFRSLGCVAQTMTPLAAFVSQISLFLQVVVEQAKKKAFVRALEATSGVVFSAKRYDQGVKWLKTIAKEYEKLFIPTVKPSSSSDPSPQYGLAQLAKYSLVMWMLGVGDNMAQQHVAPVLKALLVFLVYSRGEEPSSVFMKDIKQACKSVDVVVPEGIAMKDSGKGSHLKLGGPTAQKLLPTALKYSLTASGSLEDLQNKAKELAEACRSGFHFDNPMHRALLVDYQCMVLEESAAKFLKKLFGKAKKAPQDQVKKAFDFLKGVNMVFSKDDSERMLKAFKAGAQNKYDTKQFVQIDCRWKSDPEYQQMMVLAATGSKDTSSSEYSLPSPPPETCAAHAYTDFPEEEPFLVPDDDIADDFLTI